MSKENPIPAGMTKADYMEFKFDDALIEMMIMTCLSWDVPRGKAATAS